MLHEKHPAPQKSLWQLIIVGGNWPKGLGGRHLPTLEKEVATIYHEAHKHSLQYDWLFGVQVGTWNISSLRGKLEVLKNRRGGWLMCHLQEVKWRGQGSRVLGMERRYKL